MMSRQIAKHIQWSACTYVSAPRRPERLTEHDGKPESTVIKRTEIAFIESRLHIWWECVETLDPFPCLAFDELIVRIDLARPGPVSKCVWKVEGEYSHSERMIMKVGSRVAIGFL